MTHTKPYFISSILIGEKVLQIYIIILIIYLALCSSLFLIHSVFYIDSNLPFIIIIGIHYLLIAIGFIGLVATIIGFRTPLIYIIICGLSLAFILYLQVIFCIIAYICARRYLSRNGYRFGLFGSVPMTIVTHSSTNSSGPANKSSPAMIVVVLMFSTLSVITGAISLLFGLSNDLISDKWALGGSWSGLGGLFIIAIMIAMSSIATFFSTPAIIISIISSNRAQIIFSVISLIIGAGLPIISIIALLSK